MQDLFMEPSKMRSEELCNQGSSSHKQWFYAARQHVLPLHIWLSVLHSMNPREFSHENVMFLFIEYCMSL